MFENFFNAFLNYFSEFHFLRPLWALAFAPALILLSWIVRTGQHRGNWNTSIRPEYLEILLDNTEQPKQSTARMLPLSLVLLSIILGLMGPTWSKIPTPTLESQNALVVLVDLSLSMYADDIKPSRIKRVRFKLTDLLAQRKTGLSSLVVYAGTAHTVVPLSRDTKTIQQMITSLSPSIMPTFGSQPAAGIREALIPLQDSVAPVTLLWVTDGIRPNDHRSIRRELGKLGERVKLVVYAVGTAQGTPIELPNKQLLRDRNNQVVVAGLDLSELKTLTRSLDKHDPKLIELTSANRDLKRLQATIAQPVMSLEENGETSAQGFDQWLDRGPWFALIATLFFALSCRKGILL